MLTLRYPVRDGANTYTALTLGGVGLNFSGIERTETYLESYARIQAELLQGVSVNLPNHPEMNRVFDRAAQLSTRSPAQTHPFVDPSGLQQSIRTFIANAETKLQQERAGNAPNPLEVLSNSADTASH